MSSVGAAHTGRLELPIKWAHIIKGMKYDRDRAGYYPQDHELKTGGSTAHDRSEWHCVNCRPGPNDVADMREWFKNDCYGQWDMRGDFEWTEHNFSIDRECKGVRFYFQDDRDAIYFKLMFGTTG